MIWLYGPPGIGKSTWVDRAYKLGYVAYDLEEMWGNQAAVDGQIAFINGSGLHNAIIGAAGVAPNSKDIRTGIRVLMVLDQKVYDRRRADRDVMLKEKATQPRHLISNWRRMKWDRIIVANEDGFRMLLALARRSENETPLKRR